VEKIAKFFYLQKLEEEKIIIKKTPNFQCVELRGEVSKDNNPSVEFFLQK
jgi:hypothetical protein